MLSIIVNQGRTIVDFVLHYLDDFLFGGRPKSDCCGRALNLALCLCQDVGFPVISGKVVGPATEIDFLGLIIDAQAMEIRLPWNCSDGLLGIRNEGDQEKRSPLCQEGTPSYYLCTLQEGILCFGAQMGP